MINLTNLKKLKNGVFEKIVDSRYKDNPVNIDTIYEESMGFNLLLSSFLIIFNKNRDPRLSEILFNSFKKIINILSVSGLHGIKNQSIYSATKHGLKGFFDSLSQENIKKVSISNIFPGGMKTELWKSIDQIDKKKFSKFLDTKSVYRLVKFILTQEKNVIIKNVTIFPENDWH